jgi:CBS domain-containing protein
MKLSDMFSKYVVTAAPQETLTMVALRMQEHNVGMLVVTEDGRPIGVITDRDLAMALGAQGISAKTAVQTVMTRKVLAIPDDMDVFAATRYIRECGVRRLPIVDREDQLVGVVTLDDLVRVLGKELHNLGVGITHEMEVV